MRQAYLLPITCSSVHLLFLTSSQSRHISSQLPPRPPMAQTPSISSPSPINPPAPPYLRTRPQGLHSRRPSPQNPVPWLHGENSRGLRMRTARSVRRAAQQE